MNGACVARAISCLAQLGIPDFVEAAPKSADELAKQIGTDPETLYRLMRATASVGVLSEGPDGKFSRTPMSTVLCSNATPSLRGLCDHGTQRMARARLVSPGLLCPNRKAGAGQYLRRAHFRFFLQQNPAEGQIFHDAITEISMIDSPAVAEAYNFDGIRSIADVGGGHGLLLATILKRIQICAEPSTKCRTLSREPKTDAKACARPLYPGLGRYVFFSP
jgi:C-methyltransferase